MESRETPRCDQQTMNAVAVQPVSEGPFRCERLCVVRGRRRVLHDVNLELNSGECVSLIGPNGSGKTTLMLVLLGLLQPESGSVTVDGIPINDVPPKRRARLAAYVPQTVERLPPFTIRDTVAFGRFPHVPPLRPLSQTDWRHVDEALQLCGLIDLADRRVDAVSGGERQKTLLAAAVAQDARTLFLDEPNTALDPAYQVELVAMLRAWHARGRALVLISHDLQLPAALGGRVIALRAGRVVDDGPATEVLAPNRLSKIYDTYFEIAETRMGRTVVLPDFRQFAGDTPI